MPKPAVSDISQSELKDALAYDPLTGIFSWLGSGKTAGSKGASGYIRIQLNHKRHSAHRLAWLYVTGRWPTGEIDHKNRVTHDNRWANLREATAQQNQYNVALRRTNTSGARGVSPTDSGRWRAMIKLPGAKGMTHLGVFSSVAEASAVYEAAAKQRDGKFSPTNTGD